MKGKVVLVTGANGGLGTYVTQAFLDTGATVVGTSRKIQPADFDDSNFTALAAEISTSEGAKTLVDQVVARFGKLDVLAGSALWLRRLHSSHAGGPGPFSLCVHRDDVKTLSYTEVVVGPGHIQMAHFWGSPCAMDVDGEAGMDRIEYPRVTTALVGHVYGSD